MTPSPRRRQRLRMRRTSPDAPQGLGPVAVVLAFCAVIAVLTVGSLGMVHSSDTATEKSARTATKDRQARAESSGGVGVTSTLIFGSTTLFVTTTTPLTTTSSTSTTTTTSTTVPVSQRLRVSPTSVRFDAATSSVSLSVSTPLATPVGVLITGVPVGIVASPSSATVTATRPVTIVLSMPSLGKAESGRIIVAGSDGSRTPVTVTVANDPAAIQSLAVSPAKPSCGQAVTVTAIVSGSDVDTVDLMTTAGGTTTRTAMEAGDGGSWTSVIAGASGGTVVSGSVVVRTSSGGSLSRNFSYTVRGANSC